MLTPRLSRFSLKDVEVITAVVDVDEVRSYRSAKSRAMQARETPSYQRIEVDFSLSTRPEDLEFTVAPSPELQPSYHEPEEEIALGAACFLWDYLRRCK
jgi:NAD+ synthase (glutamine-hydrolysing)